jgi:LuxR family transcriptional regulator
MDAQPYGKAPFLNCNQTLQVECYLFYPIHHTSADISSGSHVASTYRDLFWESRGLDAKLSLMKLSECKDVFASVATAGYYVALRLGFFSPEEDMNTFARHWIDHYTVNGLALHDPLMRWVFSSSGVRRWSALCDPDPKGVLASYAAYGMPYGAVVCISGGEDPSRRTFGYFARSDRELSDAELRLVEATLRSAHFHSGDAVQPLTRAQCDALRLLSGGMRLREIAQVLGISESAVKARLKSAMVRMGARTPVQAAALAQQKGLLR